MIENGPIVPKIRVLATTIFIIVIILAFLPEQVFMGEVQKQSHSVPVIAPSTLYTELNQQAEKQPRPSSGELIAIANTLLRKKGLNYYFDACEIIKLNKHPKRLPKFSPHTKFYRYPLTLSSGKTFNFGIISEDIGGPCSNCYFAFPSWQVTRTEIVLVAEGRKYRIKRPATFSLDQMSLVDEKMKRNIRTWEVPNETIPEGVSEDGTKLYVPTEREELLLEISESGIQFKARNSLQLKKGDWIKNHPKDPNNSYLSFMRFQAGEKSHIVKFSGPCT